MRFVNNAKEKLSAFLRARRQKTATPKPPPPHGAAPLIWVWFLAFIAVVTLIGSTWMLMVFIAGSVGHVDWAMDWRAGNDGEPGRWQWFAEARLHMLNWVGLFAFCLGIAAFNAIWLHVLHKVRVVWQRILIGLGIATALFMVSGAVVTQQWGTVSRERDEVVATNTARAGVAAVDAEIAGIEERWRTLCAPNLTTWQAQACRSGEAAWGDRIAIARAQYRPSDPQLQIIERAIADAREGDRMQSRLAELRRERAQAAVVTVEAEAQQVEVTGWMASFAAFLEEIRKPFIAVLGELLAMTMFGIALAAAETRKPYRVAPKESGWAPEELQVEDMRSQPKVTPQPMRPAREVVTDAETGEELVKVRPKEYWRKRVTKKGKPTQVEVEPEPMPDEVGVAHDGGGRMASVAASHQEERDPAKEQETRTNQSHDKDAAEEAGDGSIAEPLSDDSARDGERGEQQQETHYAEHEIILSDEEIAAIDGLTDTPVEPVDEPQQQDNGAEPDQQSEHVELPENEGVMIAHEEPEREPETDPSRLIAAE